MRGRALPDIPGAPRSQTGNRLGKDSGSPGPAPGVRTSAARSSPSESEDGDLGIHPDPLLSRSQLPFIYSCFPFFYTPPHLKPVAPLPTFSCAMYLTFVE